MVKLDKNSKKYIKDIKKELITLINSVVEKSTIKFKIPIYGGKRTAQEQNNIYHKVPKITQIDGFKKMSYYQTGDAFCIEVEDSTDEKLKEVSELFKVEFEKMKSDGKFSENENIFWGGDFVRNKNLTHFEVR